MLLAEHIATHHTQMAKDIIGVDQGTRTSNTQIGKVSLKPQLIFLISRQAREHYTKDTQSNAGGSSSIPAHNVTKSRGSKGTYASGSTTGIKDGRQQVISKRGGGIP
jgi:hypothetical protein